MNPQALVVQNKTPRTSNSLAAEAHDTIDDDAAHREKVGSRAVELGRENHEGGRHVVTVERHKEGLS